MNFFETISGIFTSATAKVVDSVGEAVDRNLTTDHERLKIDLEVQKVMAEVQKEVLDAARQEQTELTERLKADQKSDSWLSKNIRPMALIFLTVVTSIFTAITLFDESVDIAVLSLWVGLYTTLLVAAYSFYFGSRGLEKIAGTVATGLKKQN